MGGRVPKRHNTEGETASTGSGDLDATTLAGAGGAEKALTTPEQRPAVYRRHACLHAPLKMPKHTNRGVPGGAPHASCHVLCVAVAGLRR